MTKKEAKLIIIVASMCLLFGCLIGLTIGATIENKSTKFSMSNEEEIAMVGATSGGSFLDMVVVIAYNAGYDSVYPEKKDLTHRVVRLILQCYNMGLVDKETGKERRDMLE